MAGIGRIISVSLLLLAGFGCGPRFEFVGTWTGRRDLKGLPGADPVIVGNLNRVVLRIEPNGRFDLFDQGFPKSGNWTSSGRTATLTVDQAFDRKTDPQDVLSLKANEDGSLTFTSEAGRVILMRDTQPGQ